MLIKPEVLIVEDDQRQRKIIKKWLELDGYSCVEASDGIEALSRFEEYNGNIKIIILDVKMPRMNGLELLTHIRSNAISSAPVIICTGVDKDQLESLDIFAIFEKPINRNEFLGQVDRAFYFGTNRTSIMCKMRRLSEVICEHAECANMAMAV